MAVRVSYGSRSGDLDARPSVGGAARPAARPPCSSLEQLIEAIQADIQAGDESLVPECTTSELSLGSDAALELHRPNIGPYAQGGEHDLPATFQTERTDGQSGQKCPTAAVDAITTLEDRETRAVVQRAASRGIVAAIEAADGFKYSINNAWASKDDDGQRFSYICQDSMQNKDRHANGFTRTQKHLKGEGERGPRKPTYDCKGSVSIKCSMVRRSIDVFYRHYAIHASVAERKKLPRLPRSRDSGGRASLDGNDHDEGQEREKGDLLGRLQDEKSTSARPPAPRGSNVGRPLKRKRDEEIPAKAGKPLSLVELLKQSQAAEKVAPPAKAAPQPRLMHPPPMNYDLPSWQTPPGPPPAKPFPRAPYQPPYRPQYGQPTPQRPPSTQQPHAQIQTPNTSRPPLTPRAHEAGAPPEHYGQPPSTQKQQSGGGGGGAGHGQALFSTLKPVRVDTQLTFYSAHARSNCTNCRQGKKKCDEVHPVCGNCAKRGKSDCVYDGAYAHASTAAQQAQMGAWAQPQAPTPTPTPTWPGTATQHPPGEYQTYQPPAVQYQQQGQAQGPREESPDPWFPKR